MHVCLDGYGGNSERLNDADLLEVSLREWASLLDLKIILGPFVIGYENERPLDAGVSGFVIVAESHIAVHTFPQRGLVWVDLFSCKDFNAALLEALVKATYGLAQVKSTALERGLEKEVAVGDYS